MDVIDKAEKVENFIEKFGFPVTVGNPPRQKNIRHVWARDLESEMKNCLFGIFEENMKEMYLQSSWGWNHQELWEEFFSPKSAYLLILDEETKRVQAYSHFQFTWDDEDDPEYVVVYCYQLQVLSSAQHQGLGRVLMSYLAQIASKYKISKVMLTCFKENPTALLFYRRLGYEIDEDSPSVQGIEVDYEILSLEV